MKWEKMDFAKDELGQKIVSLIHEEGWSCNPALDWSPIEEIAVSERGATLDSETTGHFDRFKRDVFHLAGWFARGQRYWNRRGGDVDLEIAAVSVSGLPAS